MMAQSGLTCVNKPDDHLNNAVALSRDGLHVLPVNLKMQPNVCWFDTLKKSTRKWRRAGRRRRYQTGNCFCLTPRS